MRTTCWHSAPLLLVLLALVPLSGCVTASRCAKYCQQVPQPPIRVVAEVPVAGDTAQAPLDIEALCAAYAAYLADSLAAAQPNQAAASTSWAPQVRTDRAFLTSRADFAAGTLVIQGGCDPDTVYHPVTVPAPPCVCPTCPQPSWFQVAWRRFSTGCALLVIGALGYGITRLILRFKP